MSSSGIQANFKCMYLNEESVTKPENEMVAVRFVIKQSYLIDFGIEHTATQYVTDVLPNEPRQLGSWHIN